MTRAEVRAFIKSGVDALAPAIRFNNGRVTEFNSARDNEYPFVWMDSLSVSRTITGTGAPTDEWAVVLRIVKKDAAGSIPEQYEALVDECDEIARALSSQYNIQLTGATNIVISTETREPAIHVHADDTTGVTYSFTIQTWDNSSFC